MLCVASLGSLCKVVQANFNRWASIDACAAGKEPRGDERVNGPALCSVSRFSPSSSNKNISSAERDIRLFYVSYFLTVVYLLYLLRPPSHPATLSSFSWGEKLERLLLTLTQPGYVISLASLELTLSQRLSPYTL